MCGIVAILGADQDRDAARQKALAAAKLIRHRGPDWSGIWTEGSCVLAHERLAIVKPDSGHQPIVNAPNNIALAANGEIYNHEYLSTLLKNKHTLQCRSDCEVILHLYEEMGKDLVPLLKGDFAFVVANAETGDFLAARDPVGVDPLYMGRGRDGTIWFASELKALKDNCETFEVFPPGHLYTRDGGLERYYWPDWMTTVPSTPADLTVLRNSLIESVRRRLMSDVPFGVLLSGGLDSSLVASMVCRLVEEQKDVEWPRVHSFCIGLDGSPDLAAASKVAKFLNTVHHEITFTFQDGLDALRDVIYHLETYDVTTIRASTPMYLLSRKIKARGIKMVLSGEGADELFGGYLYFHKAPNATEFHEETVRKFQNLHLYDCLRANKACSAWGVEIRVPFLDRDFIEVAMNLDPKEKMIVPPKIEKHVLRQAFDTPDRPFLPNEVLWRQKEQFSDGVGYGWIDGLRDHAATKITDQMLQQAVHRFPINPPTTKEGYYYREIFDEHYPQLSARQTVPGGPSIACSTPTAIAWDKAFQNQADPSGRAVLGVHDQSASLEPSGKKHKST